MRYKDGKDCFVYIQHENDTIEQGSLELITKAKSLLNETDEKVVAIYLGDPSETLTETIASYGADTMIVCKNESVKPYDVLTHSTVISEIIETFHPKSFLFAGSIRGRELAPRISARVHTGLTADATKIERDSKDGESHSLAITRPAFGGNLFATIITPDHVPQMATIRPGVFEKKKVKNPSIDIITHTTTKSLTSPIEIEKVIPSKHDGASIADAKLIVSAGRGVKDCLDMVKLVANSLNAELGASRALVDEGVITKPSQVGQTGSTVRPLLYMACGISGALQHTAGMDKSETIIAINNDPEAPIFDVADLGIIGDAKEILSHLMKHIESSKIT